MTRLTAVLHKANKGRTFLDQLHIYAKGGAGGQGHPRYGGQGGRGGHVYMEADPRATLREIESKHPKKRFVASNGESSTKRALLGKPAQDCVIRVPMGIEVSNRAGRVLGEVNQKGERVLLARGGDGGGPLNNFCGSKGHSLTLTLDLKLLADIGLVGFPNAGKSTLLAAVSRAAPKIASYPFTTIQPQIGVMSYEDHRRVSMADLPGLIEGAHINIGMGHRFLKHIERTKILLFVVDVQGFQLKAGSKQRTPEQSVLLLNKELELYREDLLDKPAVLALNKVDLMPSGGDVSVEQIMDRMKHLEDYVADLEEEFCPKQLVKFDDVIAISAKEKENTGSLKRRLRELLDHYADVQFDETHSSEVAAQKTRDQLVEHRGTNIV